MKFKNCQTFLQHWTNFRKKFDCIYTRFLIWKPDFFVKKLSWNSNLKKPLQIHLKPHPTSYRNPPVPISQKKKTCHCRTKIYAIKLICIPWLFHLSISISVAADFSIYQATVKSKVGEKWSWFNLRRVISFYFSKQNVWKEKNYFFPSVAMLMNGGNERKVWSIRKNLNLNGNNGATCFIKNEFRHVSRFR